MRRNPNRLAGFMAGLAFVLAACAPTATAQPRPTETPRPNATATRGFSEPVVGFFRNPDLDIILRVRQPDTRATQIRLRCEGPRCATNTNDNAGTFSTFGREALCANAEDGSLELGGFNTERLTDDQMSAVKRACQ